MGGRDYRHREAKKAKKTARPTKVVEVLVPPAEVEVVGKKRPRKEQEESEQSGR